MNRLDFHHRPKSEMAYVSQYNTLEITLQCNVSVAHRVELIYGDPFRWKKDKKWGMFLWSSSRILMDPYLYTSNYQFFMQSVTADTKRIKYAFLIDGQYLYGSKYLIDIENNPEALTNLDNFFNFPYILQEDVYHAPKWVKNMTWYSIFPDRFHSKNNQVYAKYPWNDIKKYDNQMVFGGNIQGIIEKLDYIKSLGFSGIYLTPIFKAGSTHKYDTLDYFDIDPQFGTKQDFKHLVDELHKRNMKIMIDAVFNHVSYNHPFFQDVVTNQKNSQYYDFFYINSFPCDKNSYKKALENHTLPPFESFAFTPNMPKLNTVNFELREYLLKVATYWIETFDIDGWRLDVSNEVSHDFWRVFRKRCKNVKSDIFILGENWDNSYPWLGGDQHDGVMNYEFTFPLWQFYGNKDSHEFNATDLRDALVDTIVAYPRPVLQQLFNLLDSHDTKRIASVLGNDKFFIKQIYAFMTILPGSPSLFYGGEIPLEGNEDPDNRRCMPWQIAHEGTDIQAFIQTLFQAYFKHQGFISTTIEIEILSKDVIMIKKPNLTGIFNRATTPYHLKNTLDGRDVLSDNLIKVDKIAPKDFILLSTY